MRQVRCLQPIVLPAEQSEKAVSAAQHQLDRLQGSRQIRRQHFVAQFGQPGAGAPVRTSVIDNPWLCTNR